MDEWKDELYSLRENFQVPAVRCKRGINICYAIEVRL